MDVFGNNDNNNVFGSEPHDVFGVQLNVNVFGQQPSDVWGHPSLGAEQSSHEQSEHSDQQDPFGFLHSLFDI